MAFSANHSKTFLKKKDLIPVSFIGFPYPPKAIETPIGSEAVIHEFTDPERKAFLSQSLYPRELNKPTTPIYARGIDDKSTEVETRFLSKDDNFSGDVSGVS